MDIENQQSKTLGLFEGSGNTNPVGVTTPGLSNNQVQLDNFPQGQPLVTPHVSDPHLQYGNVPIAESFGRYLHALRLQKNITLAEIADQTKIRTDYLEALEAEDFNRLPKMVYVLGYVRKLCGLYNVDAELTNEITRNLRERMELERPIDFSKTVGDHEINEENERKIRQLVIIMVVSVVLIIAILITSGVFFLINLNSSSSYTQSSFSDARLLELQDTPKINITELK